MELFRFGEFFGRRRQTEMLIRAVVVNCEMRVSCRARDAVAKMNDRQARGYLRAVAGLVVDQELRQMSAAQSLSHRQRQQIASRVVEQTIERVLAVTLDDSVPTPQTKAA